MNECVSEEKEKLIEEFTERIKELTADELEKVKSFVSTLKVQHNQ